VRKKRFFLSLVVVVPLIAFITFVLAPETKAEYPDKVVEFVTHAKPGGGADIFFRTVALILNNEGIVKPKIQVTNKIGGGASVAINYVIDKKGDPYVVMQWTTAPLVNILRGTTKVKDPLEMTILGNLTEDPNLLVVPFDSKYKTLNELIDDARKNPGRVRLAIGSIGGSEHIIGNRLAKAAKVEFNTTSFQLHIVALLGGHVDFSVGTLGDTKESLKAKKIRALAIVGERRSDLMPATPTIKESGINTSFTQARGFWGPPEMPEYAVKFWEKAFAKLSETKAFKDFAVSSDMELAYMGANETRKFLVEYDKELAADLSALDVFGSKQK
jgi:putative tricarboxylic transport membrane protein